MSFPTLETELELLQRFEAVIGVDEVGRGALAGPVAVGAFVFTSNMAGGQPLGLKDSKLISETKRPTIAAEVKVWGAGSVGLSSVEEIEVEGISIALRNAALRAISELEFPSAVVLLDGTHNWLGHIQVPVVTRPKADRDCGSVAAASVVAKVHRDDLMRELAKDFPEFGWESNKGYSSAEHIDKIKSLGPSEHHRKSWLTKILSADQGLF